MKSKEVKSPRRSKKTELVRYLPDGKPKHQAPSREIAILKELKVGDRIILELEVTTKAYNEGPVVSLIGKEGPREIIGALQILKINSIDAL